MAGAWRSLLSMERWFFTLAYWRHRTPWDSGITPPELVRVVEGAGPEYLPPGRALDLGCGTGTNSLYLARNGWDVTGVDFVAAAVAQARAKAARAGRLDGSVRFLQGDVTRLRGLRLPGSYQLIFDLGCLHSLAPEGRAACASAVTQLSRPDAQGWLYALAPTKLGRRAVGLTREDVAALFAPGWRLARMEPGINPNGRPAAWYWLQRTS